MSKEGRKEDLPCGKHNLNMIMRIVYEAQLRQVERIRGAQRARVRMVHDVRRRLERECGEEELQRTSHKGPKGSSKCACVVHSGRLRIPGGAYNEMEGGGKEKSEGIEGLLVNE